LLFKSFIDTLKLLILISALLIHIVLISVILFHMPS